jgi:archaellum component FlaC
MAILFLRQIYILKQANKINYSPLMIGVGAISSLVHFIIHPDTTDILLLLRESLFPLLVALLLYIVMNILHQTQQSENAKIQEEFTKVLVSEISQLKKFILELEDRMKTYQQEEMKVQEEIRSKFKEDIKALDAIQTNQIKFLDKFDDMESWHKNVSRSFEFFSEVQLPELDNVVHKHIDILRVAEQDHYNKLTTLLEKAVDNRYDISEEIDELKTNLNNIKSVSSDIAKAITKHTLQQLSGVTKAFESQIVSLKSHTEGVKMSLYEGENTLSSIRNQSEMIMKQMVLSSKKMDELEKQNNRLHDIYSTIKDIISDVEAIKSDYIKSQAQLSMLAKEFESSKDKQVLEVKDKIDEISETLSNKIDESLEKLHEHYHVANENITQSMQILAKKAQLKKGYLDE